MTHARQHLAIAILMGLLIGHFGMAVHATTHALGEAGECELCLSYNDSSDTLTSLPGHGVAPLKEAAASANSRDAGKKRVWAPFLQRDPPRYG